MSAVSVGSDSAQAFWLGVRALSTQGIGAGWRRQVVARIIPCCSYVSTATRTHDILLLQYAQLQMTFAEDADNILERAEYKYIVF